MLDWIVNEGTDADFGARPLKRFIQRHVETMVAKEIIKGELKLMISSFYYGRWEISYSNRLSKKEPSGSLNFLRLFSKEIFLAKPPKMQFWRLNTFSIVFSLLIKEVSLSIGYHMIRGTLFAKSKQEAHYTTCNSARNCIFGHLHSIKESHLLFSFKKTAFFTGTL